MITLRTSLRDYDPVFQFSIVDYTSFCICSESSWRTSDFPLRTLGTLHNVEGLGDGPLDVINAIDIAQVSVGYFAPYKVYLAEFLSQFPIKMCMTLYFFATMPTILALTSIFVSGTVLCEVLMLV